MVPARTGFEPQRQARKLLSQVSAAAHQPMDEILKALPEDVARPALSFPAFRSFLEREPKADPRIQAILKAL